MSLEVPVAKAEESSRKFWEWCNASGGMPEHYPDEEVVRFLMRHKGRSLRVLDLGSGSGKNTGVILDLGFEAVCADYSQPGLDYTLARFKGRNLTANFIDFTKQPLPYADGAFDLIIAIQVFDHLLAAQAQVLVKEAARVLKPGGQMLATLMTTNTTRKSRIGDPLQGEQNTMLVSSGNSAGEIHRLSRPEESDAFFTGLSLALKQSFVITQHYEQSAETAEARYFLLEKSGK